MRVRRASLAALILWWVVMRSKRAAVSGRTAEDIALWNTTLRNRGAGKNRVTDPAGLFRARCGFVSGT
ncbi:hypothetical protein GCM10011579_016710 [Streptomyces albiflavescens]|uniref:Secreted protein n=1 Tax=Streptomyces albiflavescens TaxID=1623582 RepID=A0A918D0R6_9ACTN|nr:hypothetical protein GCM10011579_016710 [Streptomyces albiflavescens]